VGVLGFIVMGAGVYFATLRGAAFGKSGNGKPAKAKPKSTFMSSLEERWDERRRDDH